MTGIPQEKVLEQLKQQVSTRMQKSLEAVFTVCEELCELGLTDFSYGTIARLGKG